jgi:lysozyme
MRANIFALVRTARGGKPWAEPDIATLDAALDALGVPKDEAPASTGLKPSRAALSLIKEFEGCKLEAYPDPATGGDPWTIGWGSTGPGIRKGTVWTQEQADTRFAEHVAEFGAGVAKLIGNAATSQQEFDAMVSLAYNVGVGNLASSTLLKLHKAGDKAGAAAQFARWNKAAGRVMAGLTRRRAAEQALYEGRI